MNWITGSPTAISVGSVIVTKLPAVAVQKGTQERLIFAFWIETYRE